MNVGIYLLLFQPSEISGNFPTIDIPADLAYTIDIPGIFGDAFVTTPLVPIVDLVVGNTQRFRANPLMLDGVPWDLTGGIGTFFLRRPDGMLIQKAGSLVGGIMQYIDRPSSLIMPDVYKAWWTLVDASGVQLTTPPVAFNVEATS